MVMRTAQRMSRKPAENLLVPQGGFEPSTYRVRRSLPRTHAMACEG